jgi:MtaA/CmuA family methyltransferase
MYLQTAKVIVDNAIRFARAQIDAGADMIGVGDAVASLINPAMYEQFVLPFERTLIDAIHEAGATVKLHICGNIANNIAPMARTGADIIDVDWMVSLGAAREAVGPDVTLAGNFDPTAVLLQGTPQDVAEAARRCITFAGAKFILQPGCEVPPGTPEANLRAFCPCEGCLIADDLHR